MVDDALAKIGLVRFVALTVHNSHGALVVAVHSQLMATVPEAMALGAQVVFDIERFELPLDLPKVPRLIAWHPRYTADLAHVALRACVMRVMSERNWTGPPLDGMDFSPVRRR
ncbi:type 2 periplasmic-binding domain-containing protein [Noviherbaspirillum galbum]|uniref:LysR substrate-binding domain-containing protein n=1 Tax=Noviherbaspirillum galbum TaxID=2709383 RepID=A0A6B3SMW5_9BURK|nr:hypothetical protein [Noviherbaspirillum galbum]NEX62210.1 hypothetical protein [Noviherbaspirillum galbum]